MGPGESQGRSGRQASGGAPMTNPRDPVFPYQAYDSVERHLCVESKKALSKREYFAAAAMTAVYMYASDSKLEHVGADELAKNCVAYADALIAALNREETK